MKTKHLLLALLLAAFGTTQVSAYTLYYYNDATYDGYWTYEEGEGEIYHPGTPYKYAVWYWGNEWTDNDGDGWPDDAHWTDWMTAVQGRDNWYQVNVPDDCKSIRFAWFRQEVSEPNWDNDSGSSSNLYYDGENAYYRVSVEYSDDWGKGEPQGYWQSKFDIINHVQIGDLYYDLDLELNTAEVTKENTDYYDYDGRNYRDLSSVTIPAKIEYDNKQLTVTAIGDNAFTRSGLTSVEIPSSITRIGNRAFAGTYVSTIDIPNGVTTIGSEAYASCYNLTTVSIPSSVLFIGENVFGYPREYYSYENFGYCSDLTAVNVAAGNPNYSSVDGVLFNKNKTELIIYPCKKSGTSYVVPSTVTHIDAGAFAYSLPSTITLPEHLTQIKERTFYNCYDLAAIDIPAGVDTIGREAFYYCKSLKKATLHSGVKYIGYSAFYDCESLESINLSEGIAEIESSALYNCRSLTTLEFPSTLSYLDNTVFQGCKSLVTIKIPNTVLTVGERNIEDLYEHLDEWYAEYVADGGTMTKEEYLADHEEYIVENYNYARATIAGIIDYYDGTIHDDYVNPMPNLQTVEAPAWFFDVPEVNWTICPKYLENVVVNRGEMNDNVFGVIKRSYKTLRSFDVSGVSNTTLADEAFKEFYNLQALALPSNLEYIGYKAAAECVKLQSIDIPASVTEIGDRAFEDCRSLQTITFGGAQPASAPARSAATAQATSQLRRIGNWAFYNAHELQHLTIPEGVEEIGDAAFYGCTYLVDLVLPASVRSIGDNCFALCSKLNKIVVSSPEPPQIQAKTFYDVKRRIPVYVPDESVDTYKSDNLWGEFDIQGMSNLDDAIENIGLDPSVAPVKIFWGGQLLILRDGKIYTTQGQEVR